MIASNTRSRHQRRQLSAMMHLLRPNYALECFHIDLQVLLYLVRAEVHHNDSAEVAALAIDLLRVVNLRQLPLPLEPLECGLVVA